MANSKKPGLFTNKKKKNGNFRIENNGRWTSGIVALVWRPAQNI